MRVDSIKNKRKIFDISAEVITYLASFISFIMLSAIILFVFIKGSKGLTFSFITGKNEKFSYILTQDSNEVLSFNNPNNYENFSTRYGIAVKDSFNNNKESVIEIIYIDANSPFNNMVSMYNEDSIEIKKGFYIETYISYLNDNNIIDYIFVSDGATNLVNKLDTSIKIEVLNLSVGGGGILGSIITTLLLVIVTLLIGFPLGIFTALYLHQIAPRNAFFNFLRTLIDMLTGIPSIIYGLIGATLLIPFSQSLINNPNALGGNILAGSLTLSVMVLPVVIKATESALDIVPSSYKDASLALGANEIQTTFKVILPNALPGILSAALLTIGRVIGESAALIYVIGTVITDRPTIGGKGTSLAVHIWSVMAGENPNVEVAATIAIIILVIVLSLNLIVKAVTKRLDRKFRG